MNFLCSMVKQSCQHYALFYFSALIAFDTLGIRDTDTPVRYSLQGERQSHADLLL